MKKICLILSFLVLSGCYYDDSVRIYRNSAGKRIYSVECNDYNSYMYDCVAKASEYCNGDYTITSSKKIKNEATKSDDDYETEILPYYESSDWVNKNTPLQVLKFYCNEDFFDNF